MLFKGPRKWKLDVYIFMDSDKRLSIASKEAIASVNRTIDLRQRVVAELTRDQILQAKAVFSNLADAREKSLYQIDALLSEIIQDFNTYLTDIHAHLNLLTVQLAGKGDDCDSVIHLMNDIGAIQERLVTLSFDMAEFHERHAEKLQVQPGTREATQPSTSQNLIRKLVMDGHKTWLVYQVEYISSAMESIPRLYALATGLTKR
jgi:hypothetical protein